MAKQSTEARRIVLEILMDSESENVKVTKLLKNALDKIDYKERQDKAFISRLTLGTIERKLTLDYIIGNYAKTNNNKMKPVIRNILRMTIYQILYMDSVKDFAACSEAVNLAKDRGLSGLASFVNGVLRNIAREKDNLKWPDKNKEPDSYYSIMYSMPMWIVKYIIGIYGQEKAEKMMEAFNNEEPLMVRVNQMLSAEKIGDMMMFMEREGITSKKHPYLSYAYELSGINSVADIPGFVQGLIAIQDVSSQLAVELSGIREGDMVLDMCAAPGGKTMHAALLVGNTGKVYARDVSQDKLDYIIENAKRLGRENIVYKVQDACITDNEMIGKCDLVICDAPCSGLGVMGRKPDIRYNASDAGIKSLAELQRKILTNAVKYVKEGGILVYSTCTITDEENVLNRKFIIEELGMKPDPFYDLLSDNLKQEEGSETAKEGYLQLLPGIHRCDGFFISRFRK